VTVLLVSSPTATVAWMVIGRNMLPIPRGMRSLGL
jgi:hypothetical protein